MFERYNERAREVVVLAQEEARELGHPFIGAEHLLLGAVRVGAGAGLVVEDVRAGVVAAFGRSSVPVHGQIPFTKAGQTALESAREIALERGQQTVTPAHLLLALLEIESVGEIVEVCGTPPEELRAELAEPAADDMAARGRAFPVTIGDELLGDLGNPRTDVRMVSAILRRDGLAAGWLRAAGIDEAWVREFGGG